MSTVPFTFSTSLEYPWLGSIVDVPERRIRLLYHSCCSPSSCASAGVGTTASRDAASIIVTIKPTITLVFSIIFRPPRLQLIMAK
ncbi:MAG: hypothetical protein QCI38_06090 [Candidatus Thermoplasmatota archaeon]|nr:hypothetical protein [Candidatus Thermoplasmatota archaeon]